MERTKEKTKEKYKQGYASNLLHLSTIRAWKFSAGLRDPFEELKGGVFNYDFNGLF